MTISRQDAAPTAAGEPANSPRPAPVHPCPTEPGSCAVCEGSAWWDGERWTGDLGLWGGES